MVDSQEESYVNKISEFKSVYGGLSNTPDRGLYIYNEILGEMSYASFSDIYAQAGRLAAQLKAWGVVEHDYVVLSSKTIPEYPSIWLALIWVGAIPVPIPPKEALVGENSYIQRLSSIVSQYNYCLCQDDEKDLVQLCASSEHPLKIKTIRELTSSQSIDINVPDKYYPALDDTAFVQYTSGSTNKPKGILISYRNLYANIYAMLKRIQLNPTKDRGITWLPLYHDMGLVGNLLSCMFTQTELVLTDPRFFSKRPLKFLKFIDEYGAYAVSMPNFALEWIIKRIGASKKQELDLSSVRWWGVGAEPINPWILDKLSKTLAEYGLNEKALSPCYGLAEATLAVTMVSPYASYKLDNYKENEMVMLGQLVDEVDVKIEPGNSIGRVKIKGESIAKYAYIDGKKTCLLDETGYYDTKDIGYFVDDQLVILGRMDEMFIINGHNYFPYDIECVVRNQEGVSRNRVACFGVQTTSSSNSSMDTVVLFEAKKMQSTKRHQLISKIKKEVFAKTGLNLTHIIAVPSKTIPVTPSGKIQRNKAKLNYLSGNGLEELAS